ncbi:MAG: Rieske 2Fe-2S domain-containing protein [Gammaproteobacteria bacterium]|nr:Rieske 2Fe-2S domain-containing protein [Gammaproteobacteria bacterium]MCW8986966.1 Rieske 2Fe-2S domain-containing protein [Gammaproteobacteria bacterium]MCW9032222.1 Rieske 2Fe-2S domain-containing protein [Gammaproteobacteria bacterium]
MKQKICDLNSLTELSCKEFTVQSAILEKDAFLVYFKQHYYAYENSCPHTGVNLNWQKEQFFSFDGLFLQCSLHGALFEPDSGVCIRGPCLGDRLKPVNVVNESGILYAPGSNELLEQ